MDRAGWEHFSHPADVGIRGFGSTKAEAFEQAGLALSSLITEPAGVRSEEEVEVSCEEEDDELLFLGWVNAIIYEMGAREMVFGEFEVEIDGGRLRGVLRGEGVEVARHEPGVEVKAATFMDLKVAKDSEGNWTAQCVVDV